MAKTKKRKTRKKNNGGLLAAIGLGSGKKTRKKRKTKAEKKAARERTVYRLKMGLAMILTLGTFAGIAVGFFFLERYARTESPVKASAGPIVLDAPKWFASAPAFKTEITKRLGGTSFKLDANTAQAIGTTLQQFPYLYDIRTVMTNDSVLVDASYRRPLAQIEVQGRTLYLAWQNDKSAEGKASLVVLPFVPLPDIHTVEVRGFSSAGVPKTGSTWQSPDVIAAVRIIELLRAMDEELCAEKPLLDEVARIDISNYTTRGDDPRIVLYAEDGTAIKWGAPVGEGPRNFEPEYTEKLTMLYQLYKRDMTLQGRTRFIDLRYR